MSRLIQRSIAEPERQGLQRSEMWEAPDCGLIVAWETGRKLSTQQPELAEKALNGELPPLNWKGGVAKKLVKREKFGSLRYLAQWQGLRGDDLSIDLDEEVTRVCTKTEMVIIFTPDIRKLASLQDEDVGNDDGTVETPKGSLFS
ncbi:hypothetical protein HBO13_29270 [Pseudomonas lactis]|uniref:Uncharacterized protein n=1 Tax=Pseudomonas lactis TaxID=1615674 RepID=A0A7Y1QDF5_9PSED|nr:hypothetical protein [Pseudomonas lactis]NNA76727.1 hypothetical protein [Pseudomonas lactis]